MNIFEQASRAKLRFDTQVGMLTTEDLWSLPLTSKTKVNLDDIAIGLSAQLKATSESFVSASKTDEVLSLKLEIVKHIIGVRVAENNDRLEAEKRRQQREQIQSLIARKESESLESLSLDELRELAKNL